MESLQVESAHLSGDGADQTEYVLVVQLADLYAHNQVLSRRGLQGLLLRSPNRTLDALYRVLIENLAGAGEPFVASLLASDELRLAPIIDPDRFPAADATRLVSALAKAIPAVEATLLRKTMREWDTETLIRMLSILEQAGDCVRISQQLQMLTRHRDERVRAKAARMIVRVNRQPDGLARLVDDADPRVRANAAEGLFHVTPKPAELSLMWQLAGDTHHRPATTALAVLVISGDENASQKLIDLLDSPDLRFKVAAAWAMGRTDSSAFLPVLQGLIREHSGSLKRMAIRSCSLLLNRARAESQS